LFLEALEARSLPSHTSWPGLAAPHLEVAGATLDVAYPFPAPLDPGGRAEAIGTISNSAAGGGNVDWYGFTLTTAADVTVTTPRGQGASLVTPVLSLYNTAPLDPYDSTQNDPYTPDGHRLLAQDDGAAHGGVATVEQVLAPGTYYVAVSGTGDLDFYPFLAGSGETGATGDYGLLITSAPLASLPDGSGPAVIAASLSNNAQITSSPFAIYLEFNSPIDPTTLYPGLVIGPPDAYGDPGTNLTLTDVTAGVPIQLQQNMWVSTDQTNGAVFNATANELQIFPEAPLTPDTYVLQLVGGTSAADNGAPQILDANDVAPLGSTPANGDGQDYFLTFTVTGVKGVQNVNNAFNTISTPLPLNLTPSGGLVQVRGAIGNDPYALALAGAVADDVDLYHFTVTGTDHYAFTAAAEAGRIGSPLQPALALFQDVNGVVTLIAADKGTGNQTKATDGSTPLARDALLEVGLTEGDYYLAVGGAYDLPDPALGLTYVEGSGAVTFDPTVAYSAQRGRTVGDYLLSTSLKADDVAPHVTEVDGLSTPGAPPTFITVHFDKPVDLTQLGYHQDQPAEPGAINAVWVQGSNGVKYHPRLLSYDDATNVATFYLLDAVPNGPAKLYLAAVAPDGTLGVTDLAGNWLAGSDANGDYVVPFTVSGPPRVTNPVTHYLTFNSQGWGTSLDHPQVIGPLFPHELGVDQNHVNHAVDLLGVIAPNVVGPRGGPAVSYFEIQVVQDRKYGFTLTTQAAALPGHARTPTNARVEIFTADGHEIPITSTDGFVFNVPLTAGTYIIAVGPLTSSARGDLAYRLRITLGTSSENAVALTVGAAPPYAIAVPRVAVPSPSPSTPPSGPVLTLPNPSTGVVAATTTTSAAAAALTLPSGTLADLGAPPVGGARAADPPAPTGPDRLVLNGANSASAEGTLQWAALTREDSAAADGPAGADRMAGVAGRVLQVLGVVERAAVDLLFRGGNVADWLRGLWGPFILPDLSVPAAPGGAAPADPDIENDPEADNPVLIPDGATSRPPADWVWAGGLLVAGALALTPGPPVGAGRRPSLRRRRWATAAARRPETRPFHP